MVFKPGAGINATAATLDAKSVAAYAAPNKAIHDADFLLNIIPDTVVGAFASGEILQVLLGSRFSSGSRSTIFPTVNRS